MSSSTSILPVIAAAWIMQAAAAFADIAVVTPEKASALEKQVALELVSSLQKIYPADTFSLGRQLPSSGKAIWLGLAEDAAIAGRIGNEKPAGPEGYVVTAAKQGELELGIIAGADARGAAYGVYALLRKLGCGFYISYDALPAAKARPFSFDGWQLSDKPLVQDRLVFDWHNFLSGCSTWNLPDWKSWILQSQKQGYNAIMVHAYGNNPMAGFTFNGKTKTVGYLSTTERGRDWSTMHVNDVRKLWGGDVFGGRVFGAEAAMGPEALRADAARKLMSGVFAYAGDRKMDVYFAIDVDTISANPQELITTLPESARFAVNEGKVWLANPETPEGYAYYKAQVAELLRAYPQITHLTVWFRLIPVGLTPWLTLKSSEMPESWQAEYDAEVAKSPDVAKFWKPHNMFAIGKIVKAFDRVLKERGDNRVQLAAGSWCFDFMPAADLFFPRQVKFIGLDYRVLINKSMLSTREQREKLAEVGAHRNLIPVIWAHHDDGSYIGRPYTPFTDFRAKLTEAKACGFGIIHWTTRPLDLFFSSHAHQVWQKSENQPLRATCREMAEKSFGPSAQEAMREYLERWAVEAPMFARDTRDFFIDRPLTNIEEVVAGCSERLKLIERVDAAKLTPEQRDRLTYYKGMEEFVAAFHLTQQKFQKAEGFWKTGEVVAARAELAGAQPEKVIEQYAKVSSLGGITRGEQGLILSMNTRWLVHYTRLRQALCMEPVRYNFGSTSHDPMAQCKGTFTYHVDANHRMWQTLGAEETGAETFVLPDGVKITGGEGGSAVYREICRSGLESDKPVKITVRPIMATGKLLKGDYLLRLVLFDPTSTAAGQRVFRVLPGNNEEVDIFKAAGGANRIHVLSCPVTIGESGELAVTLTPVKGKAVISGLVLEPASSGDNMTRSALASAIAGGCLLSSQDVTAAAIVCPANASPTLRLAAREVQRYVYLRTDQLLTTTERPPDRGTMVKQGESLTLKVIVLDHERPAAAALHWRPLGQGAYRQIALSHVARGVHRVTLPPAGDQSFEYYITATTAGGQQLAWPATAPQNNQTVVVLPAAGP
jgi:hypothetical protein